MEHHEYTVVDELRQASRFITEPGACYAAVWQNGGDEILAEVHDESLGGIALILNDVSPFQVGQQAKIAFQHSVMHAIVRHVEPQEDGTYVVGFECDQPS
jgi:hypothetical protein